MAGDEPDTDKLGQHVLDTTRKDFLSLKTLGERAFAQLADADFFWRLDNDANSIYVIIKHLAGNMVSRWTDLLTSDGEKPDRDRDGEFVEQVVPRAEIMAAWERGWSCLFDALGRLSGSDLMRTVYIRREPHTVLEAILRQLSHYAYHVGQIITLAKHIKGENWQCLSIPRGQSRQFNQAKGL
jgi:hypothetical protein